MSVSQLQPQSQRRASWVNFIKWFDRVAYSYLAEMVDGSPELCLAGVEYVASKLDAMDDQILAHDLVARALLVQSNVVRSLRYENNRVTDVGLAVEEKMRHVLCARDNDKRHAEELVDEMTPDEIQRHVDYIGAPRTHVNAKAFVTIELGWLGAESADARVTKIRDEMKKDADAAGRAKSEAERRKSEAERRKTELVESLSTNIVCELLRMCGVSDSDWGDKHDLWFKARANEAVATMSEKETVDLVAWAKTQIDAKHAACLRSKTHSQVRAHATKTRERVDAMMRREWATTLDEFVQHARRAQSSPPLAQESEPEEPEPEPKSVPETGPPVDFATVTGPEFAHRVAKRMRACHAARSDDFWKDSEYEYVEREAQTTYERNFKKKNEKLLALETKYNDVITDALKEAYEKIPKSGSCVLHFSFSRKTNYFSTHGANRFMEHENVAVSDAVDVFRSVCRERRLIVNPKGYDENVFVMIIPGNVYAPWTDGV